MHHHMRLRSEHMHGVQSDHARRSRWEQSLVQFQCQMFVASWTGVVRYHGPRPVNRPNHVWVCNHTSMIDYIILCAYSPFAVIMQLHPGWVRSPSSSSKPCCLSYKEGVSRVTGSAYHDTCARW